MKKIVSFLLALCLTLCLCACKSETQQPDNTDDFRIVTSFYPVYVAALNLVDGADNVTLINLTEPTLGCMHDYTLTTDDIRRMTGADLFIASGMGMEAFVEKSSLGIPRLELLDCGEDIQNIIEDENEVQNSHYWMNIENAIEQCEKIKRTLIRLDPANSAVYERNAAGYTEKLSALRSEALSRAAKFPGGSITVYHDSLEYFADELGLGYVTIPSDGDLEEYLKAPGAQSISRVLVQESLLESEDFRKLCDTVGCTPVVIDTLTFGSGDGNDKDAYINAVRRNLDAIEEAVTGD